MLVETNLVTTSLKQATFSFSEFQEEISLDNNAYFIQKNITNCLVGIYIRREIQKAKEKASSGKKKEENIVQVVPQARTCYLNQYIENRQPFLLNVNTKSFVSNSNDRLQEYTAPIND